MRIEAHPEPVDWTKEEPTYAQVLAWQAVKTTITEILPGRLWIGGLPVRYGQVQREMIDSKIEFLVSTTGRKPYPPWQCEVVRVPFEDHRGHLPDLALLEPGIEAGVAAFMAEKRLMVHCAYGLNRSALVASLILHRATDMSGREISQLIREKRHGALWNKAYREYVESLAPRTAGTTAGS